MKSLSAGWVARAQLAALIELSNIHRSGRATQDPDSLAFDVLSLLETDVFVYSNVSINLNRTESGMKLPRLIKLVLIGPASLVLQLNSNQAPWQFAQAFRPLDPSSQLFMALPLWMEEDVSMKILLCIFKSCSLLSSSRDPAIEIAQALV